MSENQQGNKNDLVSLYELRFAVLVFVVGLLFSAAASPLDIPSLNWIATSLSAMALFLAVIAIRCHGRSR